MTEPGLLRIRQEGGHPIAEDESTAVVYGMSAKAVRLCEAAESMPPPAIATGILTLTSSRKEAIW